MAPVSNDEELRLAPLALVTSHIAATAYLTYTVGRSLYRSRKALSPSQETRLRVTQRFKLTTAFGTLAALGSVFAVTSWYKYLRLSYNVWATERGIGIPNSLFSTSEWYLRQWLSDTPIYLDALEIVAEKSRRLWWGQQLDLATISWTTLVAIEGRRRNISHLWAYALLAHLVSLSFAQNLFHVALLLTPSPSPSPIQTSTTYLTRFFPPKPNNWLPNQGLFISSLVLNYGVSLWLPYAAGTPSFPVAATLAKVLSFAPLALNTFAPQSWGIVYREPHSSYRAITKVFQFISTASTLLHTKTTLISVFYNLPESHKHRHSIKIPFDTEERSKWERSATSIERVLASINDHPAVTAAGKDVLLCALSLGLWAAVRAVDLGKMLHSVTPLYKSTESTLGTGDDAAAVSVAEPNTKKPSPGRASGTSMNLRRRGKSTRADADSLDGSNGELQTQKRRGRPRKSKGSLEPSPEADPKPEVDDSAYKPTLAGKEDINLGDVVVDDDFDWEAASLAWGLTALGGLGTGTAAVYGGECISR